MKITVEHEVPFDEFNEKRCLYDGDFWGDEVCPYHVRRDRTHGRKAPVERRVPKCTLFNEWLDEPYKKCEKCFQKCMEAQKVG